MSGISFNFRPKFVLLRNMLIVSQFFIAEEQESDSSSDGNWSPLPMKVCDN